ncbi:hypothetical protein TSMEX_008183 [Taenia solium]|eukprot:TsM_000157700 transcript=TsM_000157700 gene=TsM_000157700
MIFSTFILVQRIFMCECLFLLFDLGLSGNQILQQGVEISCYFDRAVSQQLVGLTERLSQPTITAEHQRSLLVPASVRSTSVILATKSLPISSESGGGAFGSSSLLDRRRRQLNIRDFLMDLPQVGDVNGSNLINNNGGSRNNTHSSILSSTIAKSYQFLQPNGMKRTLRTTLQIALGSQRITIHTVSVFNSTAFITIRVYPGPLGKGGDLGLYLTSPKHWKRPMRVDDGDGEEMEDHESNIGSQSPTWSKHSTTTEASFSASSSVSMGTGSLKGTPRHRRRTMASTTSSASTLSLSTSDRPRRRSILRPAVVASRRNSIRNYFKSSGE